MYILRRSCVILWVLLVVLSLIAAVPHQSAARLPESNDCGNYCFNGGVCLMGDAGPKCICLPGWMGARCDVTRNAAHISRLQPASILTSILTSILPRDPCSIVPDLCYNGGDCYLLENGTFACYCPPTFTGLFCEQEPLSACANYCHNEGHCNVTGNGVPQCYCKPPWYGPRCKALNETAEIVEPKVCKDMPGGNYCNRPNGTCDFVNGKVICRCRPTHTGRRCETQLDQSSLTSTQTPVPSQSTTSSSDTTRPPTAPPLTNLTGLRCNQNLCGNGGSCFNTGNTFFCFCPPQFIGPRCETSKQ